MVVVMLVETRSWVNVRYCINYLLYIKYCNLFLANTHYAVSSLVTMLIMQGWTLYGSKCFLFVGWTDSSERKSWRDAETYCNDQGAFLASVPNQYYNGKSAFCICCYDELAVNYRWEFMLCSNVEYGRFLYFDVHFSLPSVSDVSTPFRCLGWSQYYWQ